MIPVEAPSASLRAWESYRATNHFGSLDGLRCLSIVGVIWHHGPGSAMSGLPGRGYMGVPLFFAISGFLITTLLLREHQRTGRISLSQFYWRRSLRIFPLYFAVVAAYCILIYLFARGTPVAHEFYGNLPFFLTYTSNWFVGTHGTFAAAWSLAAEEQFYSTWPSAFRFLRPGRALWVLAALLAITLTWNILFGGTKVQNFGEVVLNNVPMSILWGCAAAFGLHYRDSFQILWKVLGKRWTPLVLLVLIDGLLALSSRVDVPIHFLFGALVAACVIREDHILAPILEQRWIAYVGTISYGMYLLHGLVFDALARAHHPVANTQSVTGFLLAFLLTIATAALSFRLYETPFLRLKSRFRPAES